MQVALLYAVWNRRTKNRESIAVYLAVGKMVLLSILLGAVLEGVRRFLSSWLNTQTFPGALASCLTAGLLFPCLLYPLAKVFKVDDFLDVLKGPLKKIKGFIAVRKAGPGSFQ